MLGLSNRLQKLPFIGVLLVLLLLIGGNAYSDVYKWVDEFGQAHYGDCPPPDCASQPLAIPDAPSEEEAERTRERTKCYQKLIREREAGKDKLKSESPAIVVRKVSPEAAVCFSPISDLVTSPASKRFTAITPTALKESQKTSLNHLFQSYVGRWDGSMSEVMCMGNEESGYSKIRNPNSNASAVIRWNDSDDQLIVEIDFTLSEDRTHDQDRLIIEIGDFLYFSDFGELGQIVAKKGNSVELLDLDSSSVSFLIKRHIRGVSGRIPRAEVRQLTISEEILKLQELFYINEILTGRKDWIFER